MILTEQLTIITTSKNTTYYRSIGFNIRKGDTIVVTPEQLPETSKLKITVKCDICGGVQDISMHSYRRNIANYNFYSCTHCCENKVKKSTMDKYGVDYYTQTEEYYIRSRQTKLERYGNEDYVNTEAIQKTMMERYGHKTLLGTPEFIENTKKVCMEKYGKEFYTQTEEYKENHKEHCLEKFGVEHHTQSEECMAKNRETKKERYGYEYYNNRDKYKETCMERFGGNNPMSSVDVRDKLKHTMNERYGVDSPAQLQWVYDKMIRHGYQVKTHWSGMYYQGTYEADFLDKYYTKLNIKKGPTIKYNLEGATKAYYSDFYYEKLNLIIEIKSDRWYYKDLIKNLAKQAACREQGYNYIFIINKDYTVLDNMIKHVIYSKEHCWQYDIRLNTLSEDMVKFNVPENLRVKDFNFVYVDKKDVNECQNITRFIERYEWLGNMPNRPTHRFAAYYNGILAGVVVMSTPNSFSKLIGDETKDMEKLISRGACASWTPKNLASSLIMFGIRWMVKNTEFRVFSAYSDTEAREIGTIYQACNFYYIGQHSGSEKRYFDIEKPHLGWTTGRNFRKLSFYKSAAKRLGHEWQSEWNRNYSVLWDKLPVGLADKLKEFSSDKLKSCLVRDTDLKHKYVYILGKNDTETKILRKKFSSMNKTHEYPKR